MNALEMKLESKDQNQHTHTKLMDANGKKCNNSGKSNSVIDKESVQLTNGFGCESVLALDLNSDSSDSEEIDFAKNNEQKKKHEDCKMLTKSEKIQERLQNSLSEDAQKKISSVLNDIKLLSDVEKLLLYLQLPTGSSTYEDPLKQKGQCNSLGKKADEEGTLAVTWIQSHLEEDCDVSLPKQEVYDEYQSYCEVTRNEPLCAADFGKVMKQIFPSVKPRRLGTRGNSRYCYSGLRKKLSIRSPSLPDLQMDKTNYKLGTEGMDDVFTAACHVLFEWAEKLLGMKFTSLKGLASHLIENMFVDNRSVAAFTLLLSTSEHLDKASALGTMKVENKNKKSETQMHLQRKIQEKELIKGQKLKLEEHRSYIVTSCEGKSTKKKGFRSKKNHVHSTDNSQESKKEESNESEYDSSLKTATPLDHMQTKKKNDSDSTEKSLKATDKSQQPQLIFPQSDSNSVLGDKLHNQNSSSKLSVEDGNKKRQRNKVSLPNNKSPVCVPHSLSGFIIVPSLQQVQLSEMTNKSNNKSQSKYKRIQPKPLNELTTMSVVRCRTGSLGSAMLKKIKTRSLGRRSSLALMQSDSNPECTEDISASNMQKSKVSALIAKNGKYLKTAVTAKNETLPVTEKLFENLDSNLKNDKNFDSMNNASQNQEVINTSVFSNIVNMQDTNTTSQNVDTVCTDIAAIKRHSEEMEFETVSKKPHLDELGSSDISSESSSPKELDVSSVGTEFNLDDHGISSASNRSEGVSIHELESDALIDYLRDTGIDTADGEVAKSLGRVPGGNTLAFSDFQNRTNGIGILSTNVSKDVMTAEGSQLSQLRILLEQNLPHPVTKSPRAPNESNVIPKKSSVLMHTNDLTPQLDSFINSNGEISTVFLRNMNPYLNHEIIDNVSQSNQSSSQSLSNDLSSAEIITEQDILTVIGDSAPSFSKNFPITVNAANSKNMKSLSDSFQASDYQQLLNSVNIDHSSTQTQISSVPPSPNTRRRAFNFMPISPRHTPVPEGINVSNAPSCFSPVAIQQPSNMVSVAVGSSQPPSNAGSPFVSPRSTPIPPSRSRHSSGQSTYSTSRHTPFQNFDSGVSSISSSPFISPQPTPVPVSRLRHNSSHGASKTVTFSNVSNNQVVHTMSSVAGHGPLRLRHSSGSTGSYLGLSLLSPRSAPLSPLVNENAFTHFNFPSVNESRSRHNSGLTNTPLSPVSEQVLSSNCSSQSVNMNVPFESALVTNDPFINLNPGKEMINLNSNMKQTRQRHVSSSVIYNKPSRAVDPLAQEVQLLIRNGFQNSPINNDNCSRSHSVPLHQMLQNLSANTVSILSSEGMKSYMTTITTKQSAFPMLVSNSGVSSLPIASDSLILHCDKSLQHIPGDWTNNIDSSGDMEMSSVRRNISGLLEGDDLQTTLEDLKDCDTDFSKFAQELELTQNDGIL